ncbi:MAG: 4-carboxy-4-hydroxy-2-oxoadipate aldolase/oxaloacetate decarboxylase [Rhodobacteraceae bacterium]|nr:4-carboxy-4-hydroxy-2-oxoadipate aldolase/oxaloacetate decarboxylase [Paracoccaceae bacterium]
MEPVVYTKIPRIDAGLIARAAKLNVADLHEGMGAVPGRLGLMQPQMKPLFQRARVCGQAITSYNYPGDNLLLHAAIQVAQPGDVIVVSNGGSRMGALWGDVVTHYCQIRGIAGAVIDGPARDSLQISELGFPVFASVISVSHPEKRGPGSVNVPVSVAGVTVNPGDLILGDADGVLVVPPELVEQSVERAEARIAKEADQRSKMDAGAIMADLIGLDTMLKAAGIAEVDGCWCDGK